MAALRLGVIRRDTGWLISHAQGTIGMQMQFRAELSLLFPVRCTGAINDRQVPNGTSPQSGFKLQRDSVGDWRRTSRALPTIKWTLARAAAVVETDFLFKRRQSR